MKVKVAIVTRQMVMGGIEKALIAMLESMSEQEYDVTVLVMAKGGELFNEIPNWVKVRCLYGDENTTLKKLTKTIKDKNINKAIKILYYTILCKKTKSIFKQEYYHSKMLGLEKEEYDIAVSYHVPASFPVVYVLNNIKSKKKIAWIHSDVSQYKDYMKLYDKYYYRFDSILCVSKYGAQKFIEMYPSLKQKTEVFYNIIHKDRIKYLAKEKENFDEDFKGIKILTVGRLSTQKGQDLIPSILLQLKKKGHNVRWYCIGDGELRPELEKSIKKYNLEKDFVLLGTMKNPYSYIKNCDIYVQPSRHEGYCITLAEARIFNKPIVTTDFVGAREQIVDKENGLIVKCNEEELYLAIVRLIEDKSLKDKFIANLSRQIDNQENNISRIFS